MLAKPVAFALVAVACIAAAAGGAYLATLHKAQAARPAVVDQVPPGTAPATSSPAPVVPAPPESVAPPKAQPEPSAPVVPSPSRRLDGNRRYAVSAPPSEGATPIKVQVTRKPAPAPPQRLGDVEPQPRPAAPSPDASPRPTEAELPAQKPWPGPPSSAVAPPVLSPELQAVPAPPALAVGERDRVFEEILLPAQSVLGLSLETPLSSEQAQVEDRVDARVSRDVIVEGKVAIPAGTRAIGSVTLVERGGKMKERPRLAFRFHTLELPDRTQVTVATDAVYREGESRVPRNSARIGGAAVGGAIIGAILGGGKGAAVGGGLGAAGGAASVMAGDRETVVLRPGMPLSVRTQAAVTVTVER